MLRQQLSVIFITASSLLVSSQQQQSDTIATQELQEIVIQAPKVLRKSDMDVLYPSVSAIEHSKNGLQMLKNLMIPTLTVNEALSSVTSSGQSVQVRINGREASLDQVRNLLPETIKRVEWIDNPGLRYKGANAVLNFIVINPSAGGSLMTQAMPALNCSWGQYNAGLKLNNGRSQFGMSANFKLTNKVEMHREYHEVFTYPDGQTLTRTETPTRGYMDATFGGLQLDYSYIKPDTTVLWVAVHGYKAWPETSLYEGLLSLSNSPDAILLHDYNSKKGFTPSFQAYLEQHFVRDQLIAIDFNGSLYNGRTTHNYNERNAATENQLTDVNTRIRDCNQAYGIEANYIKNWKNSRLTAGVSYTANRNRSTYENLGGAIFHQSQDKVYFFGEYFQRIKNVTLTAGLGAQYTSFLFKETDQGNSSWNLRPQFTATYRLNESSQFRLNFTTWQSAPTLAQTNVAPQQIDGFQWLVGNPHLKTSSSYMLTLRYNFTFPKVMGTFGIRAFTSPDAITPCFEWSEDRLIKSYENSRGLKNLSFYLSPQVEIIPEWLNVSGTIQYRTEQMRGRDYRLHNHDWSGDVTAMLQHWDFTLTAQYQKAQRDLWGESITWGESLSILALSYEWRLWEFTAGAICPFTKYDRGSKSLNKYNTNSTHIRLDMAPMPFIQVRYNIQWGHQKRGARKIVNADASVDQSSAGSR